MSKKIPFHEQVATRLIQQLKKGTAPWQKPWEPGQSNYLPMNPTTGKRYKGINSLYLCSQGYSDNRWLTYNQAESLNAQVNKGEKSTSVQYWKFTEEHPKKDKNGKVVVDKNGKIEKIIVKLVRPKVFFANVFNAEQINGMPPPKIAEVYEWDNLERVESILANASVSIMHSEEDSAFYRLSTDTIHLPQKDQFPTSTLYYATALHELGHATGHPSRLDRDLAHPFGSEAYAKEELRAEIGSMILGDELSIGHDSSQHVSYVSHWIKALQEDPMEIFRAAADAEKIHKFVMNLEHTQEITQNLESNVIPNPLSILDEADMKKRIDEEQQKAPQSSLRMFIDVPYKEKEQVKKMGAKWDGKAQSWYVPDNVNIDLFNKWPKKNDTSEKGVSEPPAIYLAIPYDDRNEAKLLGAKWDRKVASWYIPANSPLPDSLKKYLPENVSPHSTPSLTPREEFADVLRAAGCLVTGDHPIMDGSKQRIRTNDDKKKETAGFYFAYLDGHPAGYIKNNRTGEEIKWKSKGYILSSEEKASLKAETANKLAEREKKQIEVLNNSAKRIAKQLNNLVPVLFDHPTQYMLSKGINTHKGVYTDEKSRTTFIPAYNAHGKLRTMQYISYTGVKRFAKNSQKEGSFHVIGGQDALKDAPAIVIGEGYATMATITEDLGYGTVAAFDAGNLIHVAKALKEQYPEKPIIIAGDDDRHLVMMQGVNPGKEKAIAAAAEVDGDVIFPHFASHEINWPDNLEKITPVKWQAKDITEAQQVVLNRIKLFTDFNDLKNISEYGGKEGVATQVKEKVRTLLKLTPPDLAPPPLTNSKGTCHTR